MKKQTKILKPLTAKRKKAKTYLGKNLRTLRKHYQLTQQEVAEATGYTASGWISLIENKLRSTSFETGMKFAEFFQVTPHELLYTKIDPTKINER